MTLFSAVSEPQMSAGSTETEQVSNCKSWAKSIKRKEKDMKKMKKIFTMFLAMVMALGMSMTAFAAVGNEKGEASNKDGFGTPQASDTALAEVKSVEAGATVTAYRIVNPTYNEKGFTGYELAEGITLKEMLKPDAEEVTKIAADIMKAYDAETPGDEEELLKNLTKIELEAEENATGFTTFKASLNAGYWVIIVTGSDMQAIYNPMLVGIYYAVNGSGDSNVLIDGAVDANSRWSLEATPAYAKSEKPMIDKKITGSKDRNGEGNTDETLKDSGYNGNDIAIGDIVNFEIETLIPSYSDSYKEVTVKITDKLSKGLILTDAEPVVKVGGTEEKNIIAKGEDTYTYTPDDNKKGFTIAFQSEYALRHAGEKVYVTYDARLTEEAGYNFDANTNTAVLEYTNDPSGEMNTIEDETYTYTFAIDAELYGENKTEWNKLTEELLKTGEKRTIEENGETKETTTLPGAVFTLTKAVRLTEEVDGQEIEKIAAIEGTEYVYTAKSDEGGRLTFKGLDAGLYVLQETEAPEGYSLNDATIPVEITAEYNVDGTLKSYTIKVDNKETSTYTATYEKKELKNIECKPGGENDWSDVSQTHEIKNTRLVALPSTGGIGTTIFTVGGCAVMIIAAGLFFATRRKAEK